MCPRRHIHENPSWWNDTMGAYNAYERGFLPSQGGTDDQPALFLPVMATISSAINDEREIDKAKQEQLGAQMSGDNGNKPVSLLHGGQTFAKITPTK